MGGSELIIKQIQREYYVNNPRVSQYRETVLDLIKELLEIDLLVLGFFLKFGFLI